MGNRNKNINAVIIDNAKTLQKENIRLRERIKELESLVKEPDSLPCVSDRFDDEKFIGNVCISYRHDYGLLDGADKDLLRSECKEWMRAIKNNAPYGR